MKDNKIIQLFNDKSNEAVSEVKKKYGTYLYKIAFNLLDDSKEAEECVNECYFTLWNTISGRKHKSLRACIGKSVREIALTRLKEKSVKRRGGENVELILSEISELFSAEAEADALSLKEKLSSFVSSLPRKKRYIFIQRYWYMQSLGEIAAEFSLGEENVAILLKQMRDALRDILTKEEEDK